ncbi:MAG: transporter substrate-binding domain-containing protein [Clostridia bacterium]|nr:transporter substrate-binding domain-containing protein [Clostridia bacterium]MBQ8973979.1 transporter substrate-binding domain-containing protein [Clostridia bacterium]
MKKIMTMLMVAAMLLMTCAALAEDYAIATDTAFRPFEYTDETGTLVGIDVEILAAVAEDQGFTYTIEPLGWDASIAACQAGQKDGMIAGASITDARKESGWIFSDGYYNATQSMAVAQGSSISGFDGLSGLSVAVKIGTQSKDYADSLAETYGFTVVTFESSPDVYQAVIGGQCAACFDDTPIMADYIKSNGVPLQLVDGTANEGADYGFAVFSPDKQELVDKFNAGLANIKASGVYDEILAKYLGE